MKAWPLVFTCSHVEVVAGEDHIGRPGKLLEVADCGALLIMFESLTIFANAGRKFCREADQKLEDLANKIEELDCSDLAGNLVLTTGLKT